MSNPNTNDNPETDANNMVSSEPVENKGQWQKNLTYWYADGSIVIRVCGHSWRKKKSSYFVDRGCPPQDPRQFAHQALTEHE
jgi:hypothetical protein